MDKQEFWTELREGRSVWCPCCGRYAKIYKRAIGLSMVIGLIEVYQEVGTELADLPALFQLPGKSKNGANVTTLKHWGLIVPREDANEPRAPKLYPKVKRETTSYWQITHAGERFLSGRYLVRKRAILFDDTCARRVGPLVSIKTILSGAGFDYNELMEA